MRVLLTEDEPIMLSSSLFVLENVLKDAEIVTARSYDEAIALAQDPIHLAFLDIEMPNKNGLDLAKDLQEIYPNINIIFLTGHDKYAIEAYRIKASDYLLKPLQEDDVLRAFDNLRHPIVEEENRIKVICFDVFSVLHNGTPITFRRAQALELFAYLVIKRGVSASTEELCDVLWPGSMLDRKQYLWKIVSDLRKTLEEYGIADIFVKQQDGYAINPSQIKCDYYDFLDGKKEWNGKFMENFSIWPEKIKNEIL